MRSPGRGAGRGSGVNGRDVWVDRPAPQGRRPDSPVHIVHVSRTTTKRPATATQPLPVGQSMGWTVIGACGTQSDSIIDTYRDRQQLLDGDPHGYPLRHPVDGQEQIQCLPT